MNILHTRHTRNRRGGGHTDADVCDNFFCIGVRRCLRIVMKLTRSLKLWLFRRPLLQMHTIVEQPLLYAATGRISCKPIGLHPIEFEWHSEDNAEVETDSSGSIAVNLMPGRYRVTATDASGAVADALVDVNPTCEDAVTIDGYMVNHASTTYARDGTIEIVGSGLEGYDYLWSNGVRTSGPVIHNVPCGTYAATPLQREGDAQVPVLLHRCAPAQVDVSRGNTWSD